jgi:CobQ-like glutamine amidotransferase family enzyme
MAEYEINVGHLYGDLMNTYGDYGNIVALRYYAKQVGVDVNVELVSLGDPFNADDFDFVLFGGGQDYEEQVVARDLQDKGDEIKRYIENDGPLLGVCGGYQLLGHYFLMADGTRVEGISAMDHYTLNQQHNRFTGNITIVNEETGEEYRGFENHQGRTFLGEGERPLGAVAEGKGNNGEDGGEGLIYKNVYGTYFHGPIFTRNGNLALRVLKIALERKYPEVDWEEKLAGVVPEEF